jgi:hypothetical protein
MRPQIEQCNWPLMGCDQDWARRLYMKLTQEQLDGGGRGPVGSCVAVLTSAAAEERRRALIALRG